jgi:hypothetical protein
MEATGRLLRPRRQTLKAQDAWWKPEGWWKPRDTFLEITGRLLKPREPYRPQDTEASEALVRPQELVGITRTG